MINHTKQCCYVCQMASCLQVLGPLNDFFAFTSSLCLVFLAHCMLDQLTVPKVSILALSQNVQTC